MEREGGCQSVHQGEGGGTLKELWMNSSLRAMLPSTCGGNQMS